MATKKVVFERIGPALWQTQVLDEDGNVIQSGLMSGSEEMALENGTALAEVFKAELEVKKVGAEAR